MNSSVIRQKDESQNRVARNQSTSNFPKKSENFFPLDTHMYMLRLSNYYVAYCEFHNLAYSFQRRNTFGLKQNSKMTLE